MILKTKEMVDKTFLDYASPNSWDADELKEVIRLAKLGLEYENQKIIKKEELINITLPGPLDPYKVPEYKYVDLKESKPKEIEKLISKFYDESPGVHLLKEKINEIIDRLNGKE